MVILKVNFEHFLIDPKLEYGCEGPIQPNRDLIMSNPCRRRLAVARVRVWICEIKVH